MRVADLASGAAPRAPESSPAPDAAALLRAAASGARPLTPEERAAALRRIAPDYTSFIVIGPPAVVGAGLCAWNVPAIWRASVEIAVVMAGTAVFLATASGIVSWMVFRHHWLGRPNEFVRAGRLSGTVAVVGAPPRTYVAGVLVVLPPLNELSAGTFVELDVTLPLADDPRPERGRIVVGVVSRAPALLDVGRPSL